MKGESVLAHVTEYEDTLTLRVPAKAYAQA